MSTEAAARKFQRGDEEKIVELLRSSFPDWERRTNSLDYWRWKYLDGPLGSAIGVVVSGDKAIGVWHELRFDIMFGSEKLRCHLGDDTATHPDYRGAKVYDKLDTLFKNWHLEEAVKYLYVITTNPIIIKWERRRGVPEFSHIITHEIRMRNANTHLKAKSVQNAWLIALGFSALKLLNRITNALTPSIRPKSHFDVEPISSFDDEVNDFWDQVKGNYSYILERRKEYLNWRFCDPRGGDYHVLQAKEDGRVLGYVATEVRESQGYSEGYILDLLALPDRDDVADELFKSACKYLDERGVNAVHYRVVKGTPTNRSRLEAASHGLFRQTTCTSSSPSRTPLLRVRC